MFGKLKEYLSEIEEELAQITIMKSAVAEYESIIELLLSVGADPNISVRFNCMTSRLFHLTSPHLTIPNFRTMRGT
jgi:hypothetical protein